MDNLANLLSNIFNAEKIGDRTCYSHPCSNLIKGVLDIMQKNGYIGSYEVIDDNKGSTIKVELIGKINKCGVIKPRFSVKKDNFEKFEKRYLPAKGFGLIIVSTSNGLMTHVDAEEKNIGGKMIAYCY